MPRHWSRALHWPPLDTTARRWLNDEERMALLAAAARSGEIDPAAFDTNYVTGGHAVIWDFPDSEDLQAIARAIWERGGVVSAVCHGYCGLLNLRLSDGLLLIASRRVTGFSWLDAAGQRRAGSR